MATVEGNLSETTQIVGLASCRKHKRSVPMTEVNGHPAPAVGHELSDLGIDEYLLRDLALKLAMTVPSFTTKQAAEQLCLPFNLAEEICWKLKQDLLLEVIGQETSFNYRYAATNRGREQARELMQICGYIGPAPVSLDNYVDMLQRQMADREEISLDDVKQALSGLVLPDEAKEVAALAASSARSLFVFGPAGNGKTTMGRMLHETHRDAIWIPHCLAVGQNIIRIYDPQVHRQRPISDDPSTHDQRWIRIDRPFVVVGGEMTIEELDLAYSPSLRYYEAPPHVKANGGTFLIDDFGRQRVPARDLLNRWIVPLESRVDYLSLHTGQRIEVPFLLFLVVATNLTVSDVADPAFLRRIGYRLHLGYPTRDNYCKIFRQYAAAAGVDVADKVVSMIADRYEQEERDFRASEPRDLIERAKDVCRLRKHEFRLSDDVMDAAWRGFFGNQ